MNGSPARALVGVTLLGGVATAMVTLGGALASGADADLTIWDWDVPLIPVRPQVDLLPALALFYGGLVVLARAWLGLRRRVAAHGTSALAVGLVVALWAVPLLVGPPLASRDVFAYGAVGELARVGLDPYVAGPDALGAGSELVELVDPRWRDDPTPYGPLFVWLARVTVAAGSSDPMSIVYLFRLAAIAGVLLLGGALVRLAAIAGRNPADALVLALANPLALLHLVSGAHNEAMMIGLLAWGLAAARRGRTGTALVLCALAASVKLPALAGVVYIGWSAPRTGADWRQRALALAASAGSTVVLLGLIGSATGYGWDWLATVRGAADGGHWLSLASVLGLLAGWLGGLVQAVGAIGGAVLLLRTDRLGLRGLGAALLVVGVCLPNVQPWYPLWGLAVLAPVLAGAKARGFEVVAVVLAFVAMPGGPRLSDQLAGTSPLAFAVTVTALLPLVFVRNPAITTAISSALRNVRAAAGAMLSSSGGDHAAKTAVVMPAAAMVSPAGVRSPSSQASTARGTSQPRNWGESSGEVTSRAAARVSAPTARRRGRRTMARATAPKAARRPNRRTGSIDPTR